MKTEQSLKDTKSLQKEYQNLLDKDFKDRKLKENEIIKATVTEITKNFIVVDCTAKIEGMIPIEEFKKDDEAIINFEKSIFLNKNFVQSLNILADIYINKGELTKALECLKKSVKLDMSKKNIKAINSLGMVITSIFLKDKDVEKLREAKKYFEKTYELDKDNDIFYNQLIIHRERLKLIWKLILELVVVNYFI